MAAMVEPSVSTGLKTTSAGSRLDGLTSLMLAAQQNDADELRSLIKKVRVFPSFPPHFSPPLESGTHNRMNARVLQGHSVRDRDKSGKTALHYCAENSDLTCVERVCFSCPNSIAFEPLRSFDCRARFVEAKRGRGGGKRCHRFKDRRKSNFYLHESAYMDWPCPSLLPLPSPECSFLVLIRLSALVSDIGSMELTVEIHFSSACGSTYPPITNCRRTSLSSRLTVFAMKQAF